jgi:hypothetical protein
MNIIGVILVLVIIGVIMWLINTYIPMTPPIKTVLSIVVLILVIVWLLNVFGLLSTVPLNLPRLKH